MHHPFVAQGSIPQIGFTRCVVLKPTTNHHNIVSQIHKDSDLSSHLCHRPVVLMSNYTSPSQCWMFPVAWIDCICDPLALLLSHWCWQRIVAVEISQHFVWVGNWYFFFEKTQWIDLFLSRKALFFSKTCNVGILRGGVRSCFWWHHKQCGGRRRQYENPGD